MPGSIAVFDSETATLLLTIPVPARSDRYPLFDLGTFYWTSDGSRLIELVPGVVRMWDARPAYNPDARALARQLLTLDRTWSRPPSQHAIPLADEVVENIRADLSLDPELRRSAIEEVHRVGDRDIAELCRTSREAVERSDRPRHEYQRALRSAEVAARFAPWSAYCLGILAMASYRTDDHAGALEALDRARSLRPELSPDELVFKAMALHRLGRTAEAAAVADSLRAHPALSPEGELKMLMTELESVLRQPIASTQTPPERNTR
jgi:hypothetical protein